jgi:ABC-type antimicrobial peptide transport system permease subunit
MKNFLKNIFAGIKYAPIVVWQTLTLAVFLLVFILVKMLAMIFCRLPFICTFAKRIEIKIIVSLKNLSRKVIGGKTDSIDQIDLIELSLGNMRMRKTRTFVTIGGMTVGIAIIVLLVSLGYGLQELVITRVAKLEQMRQADVSLQIGSKLKINDQTQETLAGLPNMVSALPVVSVVGKVSFNNSVSDMVAYGVTSDYLKNSDIKITSGSFYDNNKTSKDIDMSTQIPPDVERDGEVSFSINDGAWIRVRENSDRDAKLLGYTKKTSEIQMGKEIQGGEYVDNEGKIQSNWVTAELPLWEKQECVPGSSCENQQYAPVEGAEGEQVVIAGNVAEMEMTILSRFDIGQQNIERFNKNVLSRNIKNEAVVNQSMLAVLGVNENDAVGSKFETSFVVVGNLMGDGVDKLESPKIQYEIVGVVDEGSMPIFYVPFINLRSLGILNYSQLKVSTTSQDELPALRKQIEAMGFATYSVSDTVDQINSFFATARLILGLVGTVALFIASLGMFNTLTVSLLERTREVGLLKAMGMRSTEVRSLFLTESIIMGFLGGIMGVLLGFLLGKALSAVISIFSIAQGLGPINITYIPWNLALLIALISLLVGIFTGIYPAMRAQRISALNALRYE